MATMAVTRRLEAELTHPPAVTGRTRYLLLMPKLIGIYPALEAWPSPPPIAPPTNL